MFRTPLSTVEKTDTVQHSFHACVGNSTLDHLSQECIAEPGMVTHVCNPSDSGN